MIVFQPQTREQLVKILDGEITDRETVRRVFQAAEADVVVAEDRLRREVENFYRLRRQFAGR